MRLLLLALLLVLPACRDRRPERLQGFLAPSAAPSSSVGAVQGGDALWIDVRTRAERSQGYLPGTRLVPLDELPGRLHELEGAKNREIVLVCATGHRATEAATMLKEAGFSRSRVLEGGMRAWSGPVSAPRLDPDGPGFVERFRVGASFVVVQQPDAEHPRAGLEVHTVYPGGAAHGKLRHGEVVTALNGAPLDETTLRDASYNRLFPPDQPVALRVVARDGDTRTETLVPQPPVPSRLPPPAATGAPRDAWTRQIAPALASPEGTALRRAFQAQTRAWLPSTLPLPGAILMDPAALGPLLASPPLQPTPGGARPDAFAVLERAWTVVGRSLTPRPPLLYGEGEEKQRERERSQPSTHLPSMPGQAAPPPAAVPPLLPLSVQERGSGGEALLSFTATLALESRREAARSLEGMSSGSIKTLMEGAAKLRGELERRVFVHDAAGPGEIDGLLALAEAGRGFRAERCVGGVRILGEALRPGFLGALREVAAKATEREAPAGAGVEGTIRGWLETPEGPVVLGGTGANRYRGRFLAILEPGGDDRYTLKAGEEPSLLLDLAGDDVHEVEDRENSPWPPGRALLLADLAGDDRYRSAGAGLASGYFSASVLLDRAGNDRYEVERSGLGAGRFGAGVLLDLAGDDQYQGGRATQGFGGPGGVGLLLDLRGDDRYENAPSAAVDHREAGFSQGCGMGLRELAYGGVGLLVDEAGNDRYNARDYAQGVGYFGGLGLLQDRAGNDVYTGRRYTQGAGIHGAVGLLLEGGGDDHYRIEGQERGQGMAWDLAVAALLDEGGDDRYEAPGMAQGYGAQNGLALLLDRGGKARRSCGEEASCGGRVGGNEYAGGRGAGSFAWLLDR